MKLKNKEVLCDLFLLYNISMKLIIHFKSGQDYTCVSTITKVYKKRGQLVVERFNGKIDYYPMSEIKSYEVEE